MRVCRGGRTPRSGARSSTPGSPTSSRPSTAPRSSWRAREARRRAGWRSARGSPGSPHRSTGWSRRRARRSSTPPSRLSRRRRRTASWPSGGGPPARTRRWWSMATSTIRPASNRSARGTSRPRSRPHVGPGSTPTGSSPRPRTSPPGAEYYNHSYTHPYSYWNEDPWEALDERQMSEELERSNDALRQHLGTDDQGIFRVPHFQLEACERTYDVLERLGYRADSSIGGHVSITGGLPFHPARRAWSGRSAHPAYARTHPDPAGRRPFLQLPISTDPTDPSFLHGCCSYNTLEEGVRDRTADPDAYEAVLEEVLDRATARRGLAHLFIDPPDAGFGRLPGDAPDYASAVERWLARSVGREDVVVMTTAELTTGWLERERALERLSSRIEGDSLVVDLPDPPRGLTIATLGPGGPARWQMVPATADLGCRRPRS